MVYRKTAFMDSSTRTPPSDLPDDQRVVSVLRITDPTAVGDSNQVYNMDVINLNPEEFEYKQIIVPLVECSLIYQSTNTALSTRSSIYEGFESCFILGPHARGNIDGLELNPYTMIAAGSDAQGDLVLENDFETVALIVPPRVLDKHLNLRGKKRNFAIPTKPEVWHPAKQEARDLFELGVRIAEAAESAPEIFNGSHWARYGAQIEFMDALLASIESCIPDECFDTDKIGRSHSQIVKACKDYTLSLDGRRPYLSELCATANVSERTLQNAFNNIMGMSPLTYLHRLRLHRARDELRKAKSDSTTVTDVAMNWGFRHFGDFSRTYKNCFGEVPSITLREHSYG